MDRADQTVPRQNEATSSKQSLERAPLFSGKQEIREWPNNSSLPDTMISANGRRPSAEVPRDQDGTEAHQSMGLLRGIAVTFALGCLIFLMATNMSMFTTIQSDIAEDLDSFENVGWFTSAYLISTSSLAPLAGKLASIFTPRTCIFFASFLLALGVLISACAQSFETLLIGRIVTGTGASGIFTISIIIVLEVTSAKRKGLAIGLLNSGMTFGVAIGAVVAGALVEPIGWRALFYLQSPVAILSGVLLLLAIPNELAAGGKQTAVQSTWDRVSKIDYLGALTLTASLVSLLYALSAPREIPIWPIVLSIVVGVIFIAVEAHWASDPIIPISVMKSRGLLLTCLGTVGYMMARWSVLFYAPTYAIAVRQWSKSTSGAMLVPTNAGFALGGLTVGWLHIKRPGSFYLPTLISYAVFPVTLALMATMVHQEGSPAMFILMLGVCGFTTGAALNYNLAHLLHLTPRPTHYVVTALLATFRGFAGSFGTAVGGGLFTRTLSSSLREHFAEHGMERESLIRRLLGLPTLVGRLSGVERDVAIKGYEDGLRTLWFGAAMLATVTIFVQAGVGIRGHEDKVAKDEERQALLRDDAQSDRT